jgi:hypothetical protein
MTARATWERSSDTNLRLLELGEQYSWLGAMRTQMKKLGESQKGWTVDAHRDWDERIEDVFQGLHTIALAIANTNAAAIPGLRTKAQVLLDYLDPEPADVVQKLASSLCRDILRGEMKALSNGSAASGA